MKGSPLGNRAETAAVVLGREAVVRQDEELAGVYFPDSFRHCGSLSPKVGGWHAVDEDLAKIDRHHFAGEADHPLDQPEILAKRMGDYHNLTAGKWTS